MGGTVETNFMVSQAWTFPLGTANDEKKGRHGSEAIEIIGPIRQTEKESFQILSRKLSRPF
jgi:hypothetical protein